jgi:hypothetical protein
VRSAPPHEAFTSQAYLLATGGAHAYDAIATPDELVSERPAEEFKQAVDNLAPLIDYRGAGGSNETNAVCSDADGRVCQAACGRPDRLLSARSVGNREYGQKVCTKSTLAPSLMLGARWRLC